MKVDYEVDYEVIDNFLPQKELSELQTFLLSSEYIDDGVAQIIPWQYYHNPSNGITEQVDETTINRDTTWKLFYYFHEVYNYTILSPYVFKKLKLLRELLDVKSFIRIKINMYPYTETLKEYGMHTDLPYSHKAAIFYINTCDGYTKLEDGTKIDSVANRMLLFDASKPHTPCNCTNQSVRVNINFNYF